MAWLMAMIALTGAVLNIRHKWQGFLLWMFSNAWWGCYNLFNGEYAQAVLFGIFWILSLYGALHWQTKIMTKVRDANKLNETKSKIIVFCTRILSIKESLDQNQGRIKINLLLSEARQILELLSDERSEEKT